MNKELIERITPVDMILFCPNCHKQHIDERDIPLCRAPNCSCYVNGDPCVEESLAWKNPPHKSHLCHYCKTIWRPADVCTNGVEKIKTAGKRDTIFYS